MQEVNLHFSIISPNSRDGEKLTVTALMNPLLNKKAPQKTFKNGSFTEEAVGYLHRKTNSKIDKTFGQDSRFSRAQFNNEIRRVWK